MKSFMRVHAGVTALSSKETAQAAVFQSTCVDDIGAV